MVSLAFCIAAPVVFVAPPAAGQRVPTSREQVAQPGGRVPGAQPLALMRIAHGFRDPTGVTAANDGSGRLFVTERTGRIRTVLRDGTVLPEPFLDLTVAGPGLPFPEVAAGFIEQGLWSMALHPRFRENGHIFVHIASLRQNGTGMVLRYTVDPQSPDAISEQRAEATRRLVLRIPQPEAHHNGGMIAFGPDGYLYVGRGDGGWPAAAQEPGRNLGRLIRIDVAAEDGPYRIPPDNPFLGPLTALQDFAIRAAMQLGLASPDALERMVRPRQRSWAIGLRNPYSFHFDHRTGDLFIADVGEAHWEEIDWQPVGSRGGENYGWPLNEAAHCRTPSGPEADCAIEGTLPVAQIPHIQPWPGAEPLRADWGCSAIGLGVVHYAGMASTYLIGDWCSGRVWGLAWDQGAERWQMQEFMRTRLQFTGGTVDAEGQVVAVNCNCAYGDNAGTQNLPGSLWRFVPADAVPPGAILADAAGPE
jgi:glucose/arabinose dehydrogenase